MVGATLVMPGAKLDGASIYELLDTYKVTFTAAVPTVWLMLLQDLEKTGGKLPHLKRVVIGGSACPRAMTKTFQDKYGVEVVHAWGMTEMSPLGSLCTMKPEYAALGGEAKLDVEMKQGHPPFGVEMKITDDDGKPLPWDGKTFGRLKVRGPAVANSYYNVDGDQVFEEDGWFDTGDVATIDRYGYMQITDRAKDVIKSGGEWISSIDLENLAVGHPKGGGSRRDRRAASEMGRAATARRRCSRKASTPRKDDILGFMQGKIAKWWMPDDVAFVDEIPHTATGKIQKLVLRQQFKGYRLPSERRRSELIGLGPFSAQQHRSFAQAPRQCICSLRQNCAGRPTRPTLHASIDRAFHQDEPGKSPTFCSRATSAMIFSIRT